MCHLQREMNWKYCKTSLFNYSATTKCIFYAKCVCMAGGGVWKMSVLHHMMLVCRNEGTKWCVQKNKLMYVIKREQWQLKNNGICIGFTLHLSIARSFIIMNAHRYIVVNSLLFIRPFIHFPTLNSSQLEKHFPLMFPLPTHIFTYSEMHFLQI